MILTEAYDYIDLLLDKADQPYFTTEEKNKFLNLAISDFVNFHYQKMLADEDSRRALAGCIDYQAYDVPTSRIIDGSAIHDNRYPALSEVYPDGWTSRPDREGFFIYGNQYVLPKQQLYVLSVSAQHYNYDEIIDPNTGLIYSGITAQDVVFSPTVSVKNKSIRNFQEDEYSADPFNAPIKESPHWAYIEGRINIIPMLSIRRLVFMVLILPTIEEAFTADVQGTSTSPIERSFAEHYQKQIIQLAVQKMTKVDVGLMTPPS